ncbi:hypothetical protein [Streptomyces sp. SCSIO ZS0520]|uniref:hypothetical protein n=1 Tax=Streptomyces sp. SCSIO ZS0520 TaxID=2892996 RepID=UPI0021D978A8|nr:hypothetical protein [Streptomyces sp. SCSIO ZS0520]
MVGVGPGARTAAAVGAGAALAVSIPLFVPTASADGKAATPAEAAVAAARWGAGELTADGAVPGMSGTPDWGLSIDTLIGLEATGAAPADAAKITATLKTHVRDYNSADAWGPKGQRIAGATAKLLYAAVITDSDPAKFGEYDLRQETLDLIAGPEAGLENGRVKDKVTAPATDNSNTFGQSLAVLGLARSGEVPQNTVDFLLDQQCASGGFRLFPYAFGGGKVTGDCDAQGADAVLDPDSTAMAVQALLAAAEAGAEGAQAGAEKGADWLEEQQAADGALGGSGPTAAANSNSTGLAGQALAATGREEAAGKAAGWLVKHQLTQADGGKAAAEAGAVAYNDASLKSAQDEGIEEFQRDQWRRATPQALLGLAQVPLGRIGTTDPDPGPGPSEDPDPSTTPDPTRTPDPSTSPDPGTSPGPGVSADPSSTPGPGPSDSAPAGGPASGGTGGNTPDVASGPGGSLAATGADVLPWAGAAGALLVAGYATHRFAATHRKGRTS